MRRLAGLAGFDSNSIKRVVRLTFVNGFPSKICASLQQVPGITTMAMDEVISRARIFAGVSNTEAGVAAVVSQGGEHRRRKGQGGGFGPGVGGGAFKGQCFRCGGPHMVRDCKEPRVCYSCNKPGHIANQCDTHQGNEERGTVAPAVTPSQE